MVRLMKKYLLDLRVTENIQLHPTCCLMKLTSDKRLPEMIPGQFAEVRVDDSPKTFLRRPLSIHFVDKKNNELWLLIQVVGEGTCRLANYMPGETLNVMLPLGNGFSAPQANDEAQLLLIGGGVGIAPLLYLGDTLKSIGFSPEFLLGARSKEFILQLDEFEKIGKVYITTEDHSMGERGFITNHSILQAKKIDKIYACGPQPMMLAVAQYAKATDIDCEVSLENRMACGIGACLCCVENTVKGNVCVCTEGPVFNINQLTWRI